MEAMPSNADCTPDMIVSPISSLKWSSSTGTVSSGLGTSPAVPSKEREHDDNGRRGCDNGTSDSECWPWWSSS
eukprot:11542438-Alexandrium_andersonii.AAC.1